MFTSNEKRFTLAELVVVFIIGGIILMIELFSTGNSVEVAEENLAAFASKNGLNPGSCTSSDSDRDGNVSCAATNGQGEQTTVFCPYQIGSLANKGCKLPAVDQLVRPRLQQ